MVDNNTNVTLVTNTTTANVGTSISTIAAGDILIFNKYWVNLTGTPTVTSAAGNDGIYICLGTGNPDTPILRSTLIELTAGRAINATLTPYRAPVEKVMTVGFNGISGNIPAPNVNSAYDFKIIYLDDYRVLQNRQPREFYAVLTDSTPTRAELLFDFVKQQGNKDGGRFTFVRSEVLMDGTANALAGDGATNVIQDTKLVQSTGHARSVGDFVRIGSTTGNAVAVYRIEAIIDANSFVIEEPYQGASTATANISVITLSVNFGIRFTGKTLTTTTVDNIYNKVNFDISINEESSINYFPTVIATNLDYGTGWGEEVRFMEYESQKGVTNRTLFPTNLNNPALAAVATNTYNMFIIEATVQGRGEALDTTRSPFQTTLAFYSSSAPTPSTKQTAVVAILESLLESVGVFVQ